MMKHKRTLQQQQAAAIEWQNLKRRVFRYDTSTADERSFRTMMHAWLLADPKGRPSWEQFCWDMVSSVNGSGALKYANYSETAARTYATADFKKWAYSTAKKMHYELTKQHGRPARYSKAG